MSPRPLLLNGESLRQDLELQRRGGGSEKYKPRTAEEAREILLPQIETARAAATGLPERLRGERIIVAIIGKRRLFRVRRQSMEGGQVPPFVRHFTGVTVVCLVCGVDLSFAITADQRIKHGIHHRRVTGPFLEIAGPIQQLVVHRRAHPLPAHATIVASKSYWASAAVCPSPPSGIGLAATHPNPGACACPRGGAAAV